MQKIYWTYRHERIMQKKIDDQYSLNWAYSPSFYINNQYADFVEAWLTKITDNLIPEERYIAELVPWVRKLSRLIIWEYDDTVINWVDFMNNVKNVWARFQIEMFNSNLEVAEWVRTHTDLEEVEPNKFLLYSETEDIMNPWQMIPAQYLDLN